MSLEKILGINILDCGAVGDGIADDTDALEAAIKRAAVNKYPVYIPAGKYRLTRTVTVEPIAVVGHISGAWCADANELPILSIDHDDGPALILKASSISGLNINYRDFLLREGHPAEQPAVVTGMTGARISNMKFTHCWDAIVCDDDVDNHEGNPGRLNIENCFILNAHHRGMYISGMADVGTIRNVEVWSPDSKTLPSDGVAFHFRKNDGIHISDCFAFNASIGFLFDEMEGNPRTNGGTQAWLTACDSDYCTRAIVVRGAEQPNKREFHASHIDLNGGTYWGHYEALHVESGYARIIASGTEFRSNGAPAIKINGGECVMMSSCLITRVFPHVSCSAIQINSGEQVLLNGCTVQSHDDAVELYEGSTIFGMCNCVINAAGKDIVDNSNGNCKVQMTANFIKSYE